MKYENTPYKPRTLWKKVRRNEFDVDNLKKWTVKSYSLIYQKNVYFYQTEWDSWLNLPCPTIASWDSVTSVPSQAFMIMVRLEWFPEDKIPFIEANLIAKTITDGRIGEPNSDYVDKFDTLIVDTSNWYYSYIIKREEEKDGMFAALYKARYAEKVREIKQKYANGFYETEEAYEDALAEAKEEEYPPNFYLISYVDLEFKEGANNLPLEFKQLITINLPKYDFIRADKS